MMRLWGNFIKLITFTDGESSHKENNDEYKFNRNDLVNNVCKVLGINKYISENFQDNKMDSIPIL